MAFSPRHFCVLGIVLFCSFCSIRGYRLAPSKEVALGEDSSHMLAASKFSSAVTSSVALVTEADEEALVAASFFKKLLVGMALAVVYLSQPAAGQAALMHPLGAMPPAQRALMPELTTDAFKVDLPMPPELVVNLEGLGKEAVELKASKDFEDFRDSLLMLGAPWAGPIAKGGEVSQLLQTMGVETIVKDVLLPDLQGLMEAIKKKGPAHLLEALDEYVKKLPDKFKALPDKAEGYGATAAARGFALLAPFRIRTPIYSLAWPLIRMFRGSMMSSEYRRQIVFRLTREGPEKLQIVRSIMRTVMDVLKKEASSVHAEIERAFRLDPYLQDTLL